MHRFSIAPSVVTTRVVVIGLLFLGLISMSSETRAQSRAIASSAPPIYIEKFTIPYSTNLTIQTTNLSSVADPVLHLLRDNGGGSYTQVTYNDNWSGLNARISYTNTSSSASDQFILVLRAKTFAANGTCDLLKGGCGLSIWCSGVGQHHGGQYDGFRQRR